jgi:superfamily II DNA helicase RecQ
MHAKQQLNTDFESLRDFVLNLYEQEQNAYKVQVKEEAQLKEINSLKTTLGDERFFFVIDMPNFEMKHCYGIQKWLGYSEKEFTLKKYWDSIVHPGSKKSLLLVIMRMYEMLSAGKYTLEFMVQRFSTKIAVKHRNGKYLLAKKTSSIFQYDKENRLLAYLDEFTIIGEYSGDTATEPRMFNSYGEREVEKEMAILQKVMENFLQMKVYSVNELQTARRLAYQPKITQAALAKESGLSVHTIDTYCKRFLTKTRDFFQKTKEEIPSTLEAALFLRREGLL